MSYKNEKKKNGEKRGGKKPTSENNAHISIKNIKCKKTNSIGKMQL